MSDKTDALEDLVPFAEAVLALRNASTDLQRINGSVDRGKTELAEIEKKRNNANSEQDKAIAATNEALKAESDAKRGVVEANTQREQILSQAKVDAQAAYDAQLVQKQGALGAMDRKITQAQTKLSDTEKSISDAQAQLVAIESQISTLKNRFG